MVASLEQLAHVCRDWASRHCEIGEVWFFGSRARGDNREDSDLDVALVMRDCTRPEGDRYGDWLFLWRGWEAELQALLPVKLDLQFEDQDIAVNVVAPALVREGVLVFSGQG